MLRTVRANLGFAPRIVALIARKEVRDSLRNRWFLLYALSFTGLSLALSRLALAEPTAAGFAGYGRTAASLVNVILLIVPLMGLTLGAGSIAGERERGTLATLLTQPVTATDILLGKFVGLALALTAAVTLGFGLTAAVVAAQGGATGGSAFAYLVAFGILLGASMIALGLLISSASARTGSATGVALFVWLCLVFFGDLGLMGTSLVMDIDIRTLFTLTVMNPLESTKIAAVQAITGTMDVLGPAGAYATRAYGEQLVPLLMAVVLAWCVVPLGLARLTLAFMRRIA